MDPRERRLLTGTALYVDDVHLPGALHAVLVRSPIGSGRIKAVDTSAAESAAGVVAVVTAQDVGGLPSVPLRVGRFPGMEAYVQPTLADPEVRYVGQPIAMVLAESPYAAEDAAELVDLALDATPAVVRPGAADEVMTRLRAADGSVDDLLDHADVVVERTMSTHRHTGAPLEPRGLAAQWEAGRLHVWGPTKVVRFARNAVSAALGLDSGSVECHPVFVGGMFGVRGEMYPEDLLVPWAAFTFDRPVKWVEDRREHLMAINHSREQVHRVRMGVADDGRLLAVADDFRFDMGAYVNGMGNRLVEMTVESLLGPYRWRAHRIRGEGVRTNKSPSGVVRGPANFEATFVRERLIDIAAARVGLEPTEIRRVNLLTAAELPRRIVLAPDVKDLTLEVGDYHRVLEEVLQSNDVRELQEEVDVRASGGEQIGLGMALFTNHSGSGVKETVGLSLDEEGRFTLSTSGSDVGQGLDRMIRRIAADSLGVDHSVVEVHSGGSEPHDGGVGTFSSRSAIFVGSAAMNAAERLLDGARDRVCGRTGRSADTVRNVPEGIDDGAGLWRWKDLAPIDVVGSHEMPEPANGFGLHLAVVRADAGTGGFTVERVVVAYDCGRVLDHQVAVQQLVGATAQAVGQTVLEELVYDQSGQPGATTFIDYLLPTCLETPRISAQLFEIGRARGNPLGAKGVGEAGIYGVGGAIANAVARATGAVEAFGDLPIAPASLRAAVAGVVGEDPKEGARVSDPSPLR